VDYWDFWFPAPFTFGGFSFSLSVIDPVLVRLPAQSSDFPPTGHGFRSISRPPPSDDQFPFFFVYSTN